jgi:exodeoxyribonuclease-3
LLLDSGFTDTFRYLNPDTVKYTWWSYRANARANNTGWRIDYFVVSDRIKEQIKHVELRNDILGSDHCPVEIDIEL